MSSYTRQQLENWLKTIKVPAGAVVLDVGGAQLPVKKRLGKVNDGAVFVVLDLNKPHETKQQPDLVFDIQTPINKKNTSATLNDKGVTAVLNAFDIVFSWKLVNIGMILARRCAIYITC